MLVRDPPRSTTPRCSVRRTTLLPLVVLATALLLPVGPAVAAAPEACPPGPVELVTGGSTEVVAGYEHVQGYVLRRRLGGGRSCVVPGATVELLARDAGTTAARLVRTGTTDAEGRVHFRVRPPFSVVLTGRSVASEGFASASSPQTVVSVATALSLTRRTVDRCRVAVSGRTRPAKPGTPVDVWRERGPYDAVQTGRFGVRPDGTWGGTAAVPCGSTERLYATIQRTARNASGSSDAPGPVAMAGTRTCGEARRSEGEVGAALSHVFEPYNTTTGVHGSWWGERVIANRTDRTLTFDSYSTDEHLLLRRGSTVAVGRSGFSDAILVTQRTLAPGQEARDVVRLQAANCYAPVPPGYASFGSSPGPAFLQDTAVVGQTQLATDKGFSVSDRRALTVS